MIKGSSTPSMHEKLLWKIQITNVGHYPLQNLITQKLLINQFMFNVTTLAVCGIIYHQSELLTLTPISNIRAHQRSQPPKLAQQFYFASWWPHQMETYAALLALCVGNPPVTFASDIYLLLIFCNECRHHKYLASLVTTEVCPMSPVIVESFQGPVALRFIASPFKDIVNHTQKQKSVKCIFCDVWVQNFVWNFKRCPLKLLTQFWSHTPQNMHFTGCPKLEE